MDNDKKRKKLESIESEVNGFHPLLKSIFPNLPDIKHVEYTHGPSEKGADFVLTKYDTTLEETLYIGIIVKIGKIGSDLTDIERQTRECSMERTAGGGKKKVVLSEIWVVTNDKITTNAKEVINHNFGDKKIHFIDNQKVIRWIDKHLPNYWYDYSIKVGEYLHKVWTKNDELDRGLNLLKGTDRPLYVEQDLYEKEPEYDPKYKKNKRANIFESIKLKKIILIEGGMGSGKSKLIRKLIDHYASGQTFTDTNLLPVYTSYIELVDKYNCNFDKLFQERLGEVLLSELDESKKILLLIDGVDEKNFPPEEQIAKLSEVVDSAYSNPKLKVILTTRSINSLEQNKILSGKATTYKLRPLSQTRIIEFLQKLCTEINLSNRVVEDIKKSALFKELPKSPIAAILLANLLNENSKDLPSNITELYAKYTELMLGRWDMEKGLQSQKEYEAADNILMNMADYFVTNNLEHINLIEAKGFFTRYLTERNLKLSPDDLFEKIVHRSGLLFRDSMNSLVFFKHKTFVEFMYAKWKSKTNALKIEDNAFDVYWNNIYFFYIGLKKDCPEILQALIDLKPVIEAHKWNRILNMADYFLAGFSSPYTVVKDNLYKIILEASQLHGNILKGGTKSPFTKFSELHLLWFFQFVIRESYSYEFFKNAVDDMNVLIDDAQDISEEERMYALFFVAVIAMDLGDENPFDMLIKNYSNELPVPLKLALTHEQKGLKNPSEFIKRVTKKIKQTIKLSKGTRSLVDMLYERPLLERQKSLERKKIRDEPGKSKTAAPL